MRVLLALPGGGQKGDPTCQAAMRAAILQAGHEIVGPPEAPAGPDAHSARVAFEHAVHFLQEADALVADVSTSSTAVGWAIAWSLAKARLTIVCVPAGARASTHALVTGNPNPWQRLVTYETPRELEETLTRLLTR